MFKPITLYIALRYIRAKRRNQFISFISLISMFGIALGVAVLITVLSVMNGFDQQIRERIFTMVPHITITGMKGTLSNWEKLNKKARSSPNITGSAPFVSGQGLVSKDEVARPILINGVLPEYENQISALGKNMVQGDLNRLSTQRFGIVIGSTLALNLGVSVGDKVTLIVPEVSVTPMGMIPRFKRFTVVGVFKIGSGFQFDSSYAFIGLQDAQALFSLGNHVTGLQLKTTDLFQVQRIAYTLEKKLKYQYQTDNWTTRYGAFYHAVQMEKNIMFLILLLLVAIAAFNLVSSLVMLVNDKQSDIAILRTFGATPKMVMSIFIIQGLLIGMIGTGLGVIGGIVLSLNVTEVVNFIQNTFHVELLTSNVYFVNYLPSELLFSDIINICIAALFMSLLATLYPAWRAARTHPVEALRYE